MAHVNARTASDLSHWTDADLVRAVDCDPSCRDEYITELKARQAARIEIAKRIQQLTAEG